MCFIYLFYDKVAVRKMFYHSVDIRRKHSRACVSHLLITHTYRTYLYVLNWDLRLLSRESAGDRFHALREKEQSRK